ncbi:hypothetical protein DICPUDRAFT_74112 [Dictyostelium purpureum]|uniref:Uncharacterized protein n=1 Tax=Dictyostelium purpureum TaxID=5786 RepID=F0Z6N8_DICPU|nr:uncharacterized protein DICPUDRAFT_74112 [Dictyostelium purpureum]EGC40343.1 hypothetical protein DICPUDRAFT_74112 [Dictyostelium purpureum]|eukprot:XP_003283094.1 hypothetical protein DICPUDRAFT_74112 [Dictyostelium purpureum]
MEEIWNKFSCACTNGDLNTLHHIISNGLLNVNAVDNKGRSGLLMAVCRNQVEVVKYLLSNGADPTLKDINNNNALHLASISGSSQIVSIILNYQNEQQQHQQQQQYQQQPSNLINQTILSKDVNNNTPLHLASSRLKRMLSNIKSNSSNGNYKDSELIKELKSILSSFYSIINAVGSNEDKLKMQLIINNFEKDQISTEEYEMDDDENDENDTNNLSKTLDDLDSLLNGLSLS